MANPTSLILSAAMLLDWFGRKHGHAPTAKRVTPIHAAVDAVLDQPALRTGDVGGTVDTDTFADSVAHPARP